MRALIFCLAILSLSTTAEARNRYTAAYAPECNVTMPCVGSEPTLFGRIVGSFSNAGRDAYSGMVDAAAYAAGVPTRIAHAVIRVESGYRANMRGAAGEYGIGQIKCQTARLVGFSGSCHDLFDAQTNLTYSMRYLALAIAKGGHGCSGVTLYNTGIGARPHCSRYGHRVMAKV